AYQRTFDVMNRGYSGYNTDWALPILRQILPTVEDQKTSKNRIILITIFFGANDAALPFAYQHVPITRFTENLSEMFNMIQNPNSQFYNPNAKIILITQPPVNEVQWKKRCDENGDPMNRTAEVAKAYAEAAREIAGQHQVPVCDLWTELMQLVGEDSYKHDLSEFLLDGLHLNSNGNKVSGKTGEREGKRLTWLGV
ncbi:SGNH hydrolase-type esterase domain-containing protein, partial [Umbelopsis sp. PMI_123]